VLDVPMDESEASAASRTLTTIGGPLMEMDSVFINFVVGLSKIRSKKNTI